MRLNNNKGFLTATLAIMILLIPIVTLIGIRFYNSIQKGALIQKRSTTMSQMNSMKTWLIFNAADPDNDQVYELLKENAGYTLPLSLPMKSSDAYGATFRYYTWDLGGANGNAAYSQNASAPPLTNLVGRIISAGPDGIFQTTSSSTTVQGDDIMIDIFTTDSASSTDNSGWKEDTGNNKVILKTNGRWVAIGTATPTAPLTVVGDTNITGNTTLTGDVSTTGSLNMTSGTPTITAPTVITVTNGIRGAVYE